VQHARRAAAYRGTHNDFLVEHAAGLRPLVAPFRRAQFRSEQRLRQSFDEHEALLREVLRGDGEEAARLMRAHMLVASATLAAYMGETGAAPGSDEPLPPTA